jgi:hypothetical protein
MEAFLRQGAQMETAPRDMPVKIALNDNPGIIGCPLHPGAEGVFVKK